MFTRQYRRILKEIPCLPDEVKSNIGNGDILLQDGTMPRPFAVAMTQDQYVIRQVQSILQKCR